MALPVPNLDDRRFQDFVDDAKRLIAQRCPAWTDHNVSDPGVTLIELFAFMTDQLVYRLNRVPERQYVTFLDLLGVKLFPPTTAASPLTFWLTAPQPTNVTIPAGTQAATIRTETEEAVIFQTTADLEIVRTSLAQIGSMIDGKTYRDHAEALAKEKRFSCFADVPQPGDALYVGLTEPAPSCAISLRFACHVEGIGVDPDWPPLAWEAWDGDDWAACDLERDETGGLNRDGDVVVHVPAGHAGSVIGRQRAGWIRARVTEPEPGQPTYSTSPSITGLTAFTAGGTVEGVNAELIDIDDLGEAEGVAGQVFSLRRRPVVPGDEPPVLEVRPEGMADGDEPEEWTLVDDFGAAGPDDQVFTIDPVAGDLHLGPAVRLADGGYVRYGATPAKGAQLRLRGYRAGGGELGNVASGAISVLRSSIPYVDRVTNRRAATGGVDGETIDNAKVRGPLLLRTRGRAVTTEDYENLARSAAPEVARVRAVAATDGGDAGSVRVLVVPSVAPSDDRLRFEQLVPADATLQRITDRLEETRVIGTRLVVEPPVYRGVTVVAKLRARPRANPGRVQDAALEALFGFLDPIRGGPDGTGWPFGRPVTSGELNSVLQQLRGTEIVDDLRIFGADPVTGQRGQATTRLELEPTALVFSYEHQVLVEAG
jgi:predicted phage baseplate assembly protein